MKEPRQFTAIVDLIKSYKNQQPLHRFLQHYFRSHRQMGSKDRKLFSTWIYNYYRLGKSLPDQTIEIKLTLANFLLQQNQSELLKYALDNLPELTIDDVLKSMQDKLILISHHY